MLGERIKQARKSAGLSQRALADQSGVSAMAISKYERDTNTPSSKVLIQLGRALGVRVEYFFRAASITLQHVEHRKIDDLPKKECNRVLADVTDQVERRIELGKLLPDAWEIPFNKPTLPRSIDSMDQIEGIADKVRAAWNLGNNPIQDLMDTLEEHGLKVFTTTFADPNRLDGLSAEAEGMPVIVVGTGEQWVGDRQRFTLAHELAHFLLDKRLPANWPDKKVERACHRFSGAFLAPASEVKRALGSKRKHLEPQELYQLKHEFGLSMAAWTFRARDLDIITAQVMSEIWTLLKEKGWNVREPGEQYPREIARRFKQHVYRALAEGIIGEARAAELLQQTLYEFRAERYFSNDSNDGNGDRPDNAAD